MIKFTDAGMFHVEHIPNWFYIELANVKNAKRTKGNQRTRNIVTYKDVVSAFDIETTRLHDYTREELQTARDAGTPLNDETTMYIWQWCFTWNISKDPANPEYKETVIYGRTWKAFKAFIKSLEPIFKKSSLMVFIHNEAYEFQFVRSVLPFKADDVFNVKARQPIKATTGFLEFRCSYKQSNMSLRKFAENMQTPHQKTELDYDKKRYWYTPLTQKELEYAVNDVYCLVEAIVIRMFNEGDTLYTIPLTSTGYVRRDVKASVNAEPYTLKQIKSMMPNLSVYKELKEAFRGGNTHANRYFSNEVIKGELIHSADRSSSYPAVICNREYPMTKFEPVYCVTNRNVLKLLNSHKRAMLMRVKFTGVSLVDDFWGCPYISLSKCRNLTDGEFDNGRVLSASYLETTVTDVDLRIILEEYKIKNIEFEDVYSARYGKIPDAIVKKVIEYYEKKTSLKGVAGQEYFYTKNKNLLNSIYGMMVQELVKVLILYAHGSTEGEIGEFMPDPVADEAEILKKSEKRGFLNYAWGVWVTAWARYELEQGIKLVHNTPGADFIYCDTDSVKYLGDVDWTNYNNARISESTASGSLATDPEGITHYMGVFEQEHDMSEFVTMGAKKYAYIDAKDNSLTITVAGVGKKAGAKELQEKAKEQGIADPLDLFREGFTFIDAGGLEAVYNDRPYSDTIPVITNEEGKPIELTSNVTLRPSTYTLGLTAEYRELIEGLEYTNGDDIDG